MRVVEFFCGIGGCSAACPADWEVVAAIDIQLRAMGVYRANFKHTTWVRGVEHLTAQNVADWRADVWWFSPPCQPFTVRGRQRDLDDSRAAMFPQMVELVRSVGPSYIALENVFGFGTSRAAALWRTALRDAGYWVVEVTLCPTQCGVPARRPRWFVMAARDHLPHVPAWVTRGEPDPSISRQPLRRYLTESDVDAWRVPATIVAKYSGALHAVDPISEHDCCRCFTSAYGRSPVRSGSYVRTPLGLRYATPAEILSLLGFPDTFCMPHHLTRRQAWSLVGNSLSVPCVQRVLQWMTAKS